MTPVTADSDHRHLARAIELAERGRGQVSPNPLVGAVLANVDGVLQDIDTEFLHDLRVSVRRTRSALKLFGEHR